MSGAFQNLCRLPTDQCMECQPVGKVGKEMTTLSVEGETQMSREPEKLFQLKIEPQEGPFLPVRLQKWNTVSVLRVGNYDRLWAVFSSGQRTHGLHYFGAQLDQINTLKLSLFPWAVIVFLSV